MILTEEEYRKKRCFIPLELESITDCTHLDTVVGGILIPGKCTASECPAWRWEDCAEFKPYKLGGNTQKGCETCHGYHKEGRRGYCGLAGKP